MANKRKAKEFLQNLIGGIIRHPGDLKIESSEDELGILLQVKTHRDDMGMVIGRKGVNANAIKLIMKIYGYVHKSRVSVKILEPED